IPDRFSISRRRASAERAAALAHRIVRLLDSMIRGTRSQSSQDNAQPHSPSNECGTEAPRLVSPNDLTLSPAPIAPRRTPSFLTLIHLTPQPGPYVHLSV